MSRRISPIALVLSAVLVATACGDDDPDDAESGTTSATAAPVESADAQSPNSQPVSTDTASAEWSWVDGSGKETTVDHVPTRIVAHGSAAAALIPLGIRPVGIYADTAIAEDLALQQPRPDRHRDRGRGVGADQRRGGRRPATRPDRRRVVAGRAGLQRSRARHQQHQSADDRDRPDRRRGAGAVDRHDDRRLPRTGDQPGRRPLGGRDRRRQ